MITCRHAGGLQSNHLGVYASESAPSQQPCRRHRPVARRDRRPGSRQGGPAEAEPEPAQAAVQRCRRRQGRCRRDGARPPRAVHGCRCRVAPADEGAARRLRRPQLPLQPDLPRHSGVRRGRGGQRGRRRQRARHVRQPHHRPGARHRLHVPEAVPGRGAGRRQARRPRQWRVGHADLEREVQPGHLHRRRRARPPRLPRRFLRRLRHRRQPDPSERADRREQRPRAQAVGKPAARAGRHRPRRQHQDRPVRVRHQLRLPGRHAERHHLHDEQRQREDRQPQQRQHQHQHHRVLLHLPAQHGEVDQWRVFAAERRTLLRRRDLQHVPGLHRHGPADLPAADEGPLQDQLRERVLERHRHDLRRWGDHVPPAGQPGRVLARGLARLHRAAVQPDLFGASRAA